MTWSSLLAISFALSMDAAAVALCNVMAAYKEPWSKLIWMPILFGFFQGLMPFFGYFAGQLVADFIGQYAEIIFSIVLAVIGIHMIKEGREIDESCSTNFLSLKPLIVQAIATSIDALVVGVSFGTAGVPIASTLVIGIVTFSVVGLSLIVGRRFGSALGSKAQVFGGFLLLLIAANSIFF